VGCGAWGSASSSAGAIVENLRSQPRSELLSFVFVDRALIETMQDPKTRAISLRREIEAANDAATDF
jgi:hypothetical protein